MKKIDLGQTLLLLGNAGVIIGILLLGYELNQNRDMMRAQTRNELSQGLIEILLELANDDEDASIYLRGSKGEDLTEVESERFRLISIAQLRYHENVYYQYRNGLYDDSEYFAQRELWRNEVFNNKGMVDVWCPRRSGFSAEFVAEVGGLPTTYTCD